jgi:hypothetical protein
LEKSLCFRNPFAPTEIRSCLCMPVGTNCSVGTSSRLDPF